MHSAVQSENEKSFDVLVVYIIGIKEKSRPWLFNIK